MRALHALAAFCSFWILACCFPSKELEEKREATNVVQAAIMDAIRIQLKIAAATIPSEKPQEQRCPDDALGAKLKDRKQKYPKGRGMDTPIRIELGALEAIAGLEGKDTRKSPILDWMSDDTVGRVFAMTEKTGYSLSSEAETLTKRFGEKGSQISVFRITKYEAPLVTSPAGPEEVAKYDGGSVAAWLILWDLDTNSVVCAAPFSAQSSKEVTFRDAGKRKRTLEESLQADLVEQLKEAATKARNGMTAVYKVGVKLLEL